ncbi:MAG: phosphoribosylformylglycinamidine synthase subunit PurS [Nitrospira sp.]|nr:phosphoribosylformylglycinamidine synthase subunit PurS [Candidatus Manganitrophaceae bacterium]HIL34500.1 phosphoribosylformylglycinamidine synthase subunit PurS [Candidatus Manganitrophaceae bacterium]
MKAKVYVIPKDGILDPQGKAVERALTVLGFKQVKEVRVGRFLELVLDPAEGDTSEKTVKEMCEKLLANTIVESYRYELDTEG